MVLQTAIIGVTPFEQNCTLLWEEESKKAVVIDPGGDIEKIEAAIARESVSVEAIWLTHGHIDHAGGAMDLKESLGLEIIGPHKADLPLLSALEDQARMFGLSEPVRNAVPDRWLEEGDFLEIGAHKFEIFHCPGHAPGHIVFYHREANFAHVGDVLFSGSIGRTDLPGGDHAALLRSIKEKLMLWPDSTRFICGHGPSSTIGEERAHNPFLR